MGGWGGGDGFGVIINFKKVYKNIKWKTFSCVVFAKNTKGVSHDVNLNVEHSFLV